MNLKPLFRQLIYSYRRFVAQEMRGPARFFYRNLWKPKPGTLQEALDEFSRKHPGLFFVQVGSNDGFINDPLFKFIRRDGWKGIMIEPQTRPYNILKKIYEKDDIRVVNKAIDRQKGHKELYRLAFTNARWANGLSTFNKAQLEKMISNEGFARRLIKEGVRLPEKPEDIITSEIIECITFNDLLEEQGIEHIHLLETDTEGYDFEILKMFDFSRYKPGMVIYEHLHFSEETAAQCSSFMKGLGYKLKQYGPDTVGRLEY